MKTPEINRRTAIVTSLAFLLGGCKNRDQANEAIHNGKPLSAAEFDALLEETSNPMVDSTSEFHSRHNFRSSDIPGRLEKINWFTNCGKPVSLDLTMPYRTVASWDSATRSCNTMQWENVRLDADGQLTVWLHLNDNDNYQKWNDIVRDHQRTTISKLVENSLRPVQKKLALDDTVVTSVLDDVAGVLMSNSYLPSGHTAFFYFELMMVYEAGHFPCGWRGQWPAGELIVY